MTMTTHHRYCPPTPVDLDRATALRLAATEYGRYLDQLRSLGPDDWSRPTDCPAWDVRAMAAHNLGMAEMAGSLPEMVRQFVGAGRREEEGVDALTAYQVEGAADADPGRHRRAVRRVVPRAVRGRRRRSALVGTADRAGEGDGQRRGGVVDVRLHVRDHPDPGHLDAPDRHRRGHRPAAGPDRRARRRTGGRRGGGVGGPARCPLHPAPDRTRRGSLVSRAPAGRSWTLDAVLFARTLSGRSSGERPAGRPGPVLTSGGAVDGPTRARCPCRSGGSGAGPPARTRRRRPPVRGSAASS